MRDPVKLTNNLQNNKYRCCSYVIQNRGVPCCYPIRYYYHLVYLSDSSRITSITKELIENTRCLFPVMTNYWINALVNIMRSDRWNDHNPKYSPIIIILKFNRTNPAIGNRGMEGENLRSWQRWLNISFIRNRCWTTGFYRFRLPSRKMAVIFTFCNSLWFIRRGKIGTATILDISYNPR